MRSAVFVDFDNVFSQLRQLQPEAAERFARHPSEWIAWLTTSLPLPEPAAEGDARRLLVRRCYLNPNWYQSFRHAFLRAGFEIVDCPPVTSQGKTSTDIHMVLDIIDVLQAETRCDEFIVFSADADFTPVLRRLRRHDRRTTVLAIGFPSAAYQASADLLIDERLFLRDALGLGPTGAKAGAAAAPAASAAPAVSTSASSGAAAPPPEPDPDAPWAGAEALFPVVREVCESTDAPMLAPRHLQLLIGALAAVLREQAFSLQATVHAVCRRCLESGGVRIRPRDVTFIVRGLQMNGHVFGQGGDDEATLAGRLFRQVLFLCEREQKLLSPADVDQIRAWIGAPEAPMP